MDASNVRTVDAAQSTVLLRFRQIEGEARDTAADLEAALKEDSIFFQQGRRNQKIGMVGSALVIAFLGGWMAVAVYEYSPWLTSAILAVVLFVVAQMPAASKSNIAAQIHAPSQTLILYGHDQKPRTVLRLQEIDFFLCRSFDVSEGGLAGVIHAVLLNGAIHEVTAFTPAFDYAEKQTRILGWICDRAAFSINHWENHSFGDCSVSVLARGKTKLWERAKVLHAPSS